MTILINLLKPFLKYIISGAIILLLLGGIYLKGRSDGANSVQHKMDVVIAKVKAEQVLKLQEQALEKDKIITQLESRSSERQKQIQTIIKTVKISDNKECTLNKEAIDLLNTVR